MRRFLVGLLVLLGCPAAWALTVVPRSFDELVGGADVAFKGTVAVVSSQWVGTGADRHIVTYVTFRVEETYKGAAADTQTLRFFGGTVDGTTMAVPDMPRFDRGQVAVLFVTGNGQQFCPLVGVHQGRFHVTRDASGAEHMAADDGSPLVKTSEIGQVDADGGLVLRHHAAGQAVGMTLGDFRAEIRGKVASQAAQTPASTR